MTGGSSYTSRPPRGGFIREPLKRKDYSYERAFGGGLLEQPKPLGRYAEVKAMKLDLVYQGDQPSCVHASVTWLLQYLRAKELLEAEGLSLPYLVEKAGIGPNGARPSVVLETARTNGVCRKEKWNTPEEDLDAAFRKLPGYFTLDRYDLPSLYAAMKMVPILVGIQGFDDGLDHMMVAEDFSERGRLLCVNWWNPNMQEVIELDPSERIVWAAAPIAKPAVFTKREVRFPLWRVLLSKLAYLL